MATVLKVKVRDRWYTVEVGDLDATPVQVLVDGELVEVQIDGVPADGVDGSEAGSLAVNDSPAAPAAQPPLPQSTPPGPIKVFASPMPGVIVSVAVGQGDQIVTGDEVCVLEAMKMQQTLRADWSGVVSKVHVAPGQQVLDGDPLVELA